MGIIQDFWGYIDINFNIMQFSEDQKQYSAYGSEKIEGNFDTRPSHSEIVGLQSFFFFF